MGVESSTCFLLDLLLKFSTKQGEKLLALRISERHDLAIKHVCWYGNDEWGDTLSWPVEIDHSNLQTNDGTSTLSYEQRFPAVRTVTSNVNIQLHGASLPTPRYGD